MEKIEMSEDNGQAAEAGGTDQEVSVPDVAKLQAELDHIKKSQQGSDRAANEWKDKASIYESEINELKESLKSKMSDEEKRALDETQLKSDFETLRAKLDSVEAERRNERLENHKLKVLSENGLDTDFADIVNGIDEEDISKKIAILKEKIGAVITKEKTDIYNGSDPASGRVDQTGMTQEKFRALSMMEQTRLVKENPDYKKYLKT